MYLTKKACLLNKHCTPLKGVPLVVMKRIVSGLHVRILLSLFAAEKRKTWSCKEARHEMHDKNGMYNEAAMEELIILLYKKT